MSFMPRPQTMQPMADEVLAQAAPSAFAPLAHGSRSHRYAYIPTSTVIDALRGHGFSPVWAMESRTRDASRRGYTKHQIRFRHASTNLVQVGDTFPEVVLVNSHDGTSTYQIFGGLYRLICSNGMTVADGRVASVKVPHKGDVTRMVIDGTYEVLESSTKALTAVQEWSGINLNRDAQMALAEAAHSVRFDEAPEAHPIRPEQLLTPRRYEDRKDDLWTVWNRIQENATKGGLEGRNPETGRRVSTKGISSIDGDLKLQRGLWMLGERMAEIMGRR